MIDIETWNKIEELVLEWTGKENRVVPANVVTEMFNAHNKSHPNQQEHSRSCGGCRSRVWLRLKNYYAENKHLYTSE